ncbi:MAG TPA: hypothetical protein PKE64_20240 [Anaerolineae bacterium]|nr:hypothetical protein [Anaerolineae bacterium]
MLALLFIGLGGLLALAGLVALTPQIRRHQIEPQSWRAWLFRAGAVAVIAGQVLCFFTAVDEIWVTATLLIGWAILFASVIVVSHERYQPGYRLGGSLSLQIFALGVIVTGLAWVLGA